MIDPTDVGNSAGTIRRRSCNSAIEASKSDAMRKACPGPERTRNAGPDCHVPL
jgi:hypothetical protein